MAQPAFVQAAPESAICQGQDWWVEGAIQILVTIVVCTGPGAGTSINARDDRGAEHDVRGVPVVQSSRKASKVCNDTSSNHEDRLVSCHHVLFESLENISD